MFSCSPYKKKEHLTETGMVILTFLRENMNKGRKEKNGKIIILPAIITDYVK